MGLNGQIYQAIDSLDCKLRELIFSVHSKEPSSVFWFYNYGEIPIPKNQSDDLFQDINDSLSISKECFLMVVQDRNQLGNRSWKKVFLLCSDVFCIFSWYCTTDFWGLKSYVLNHRRDQECATVDGWTGLAARSSEFVAWPISARLEAQKDVERWQIKLINLGLLMRWCFVFPL